MELKGSTSQRVQWVLIFLAHLILLYWMYYALTHGGDLSSFEMVLHFSGMALYGGLLIYISAMLGRRNYRIDQKNKKI